MPERKDGRTNRLIGIWLLFAATALCLQISRTEHASIQVSGTENEDTSRVAITFDDGPHFYYTKLLLDGLRARNVRATFFLIGESIAGKEELVRQMALDGHLIGNHTWHHVSLAGRSFVCARQEIEATNNCIFQLTGYYPEFIRPPYGNWDKELEMRLNMIPILWDVDPLDWKNQDEDQIVAYVLSHAKNGDIILLHDIYESSVRAALRIIDALQQRGFEFVTADAFILD